jgi:hypothetical protein
VHADDLPGGRNDYLSQRDVVSQTQSEHNAALLVLCVLGLMGTGHHIDLFGPASNLPVGAAGLIMWGLVYIHIAPRADTQRQWFHDLATANADAYLNREITNGTPDPVGLAVGPLDSTVAYAHFPTPNQMRDAAKLGLSTHWHAAPAGTHYALQPNTDHAFRNQSYMNKHKCMVTPLKVSITYDWMPVDGLKSDAPPLHLPADFEYLAQTDWLARLRIPSGAKLRS